LAGQIKHSYLRTTIGGNIFSIKHFYIYRLFRFLG
jgi:hypothetical protein